ncbi:radical SAM protein [Mesorhizobium sp.]|uniref:radical SAM protein n=1 Tax=Mesorhizobium sp. TaxID=1871066 RepID=UPI000FEA9A37|nr:radical SAM protein [Mesorhizobium sp.]RWQ20551.1 MAG: radical SAM protein [Mesorhizobium sp.]
MSMQLYSGDLNFPIEIEWSLTWACNAQCFFCSTGNFEFGAKANNLDRVVSEIGKLRPLVVTLSGGEPTVHPQFPYILKKLLDSKQAVNITTNAVKIDKTPFDDLRKVNWIRISLHATSAGIAKEIMGASYDVERVKTNIRSLVNTLPNRVSVFCLVTRQGEKQDWSEYFNFVREVGITKIDVGFIKLLGWASKSDLVDKSLVLDFCDKVSELGQSYGVEVFTPDMTGTHHACLVRSTNLAILPDGSVEYCSFDRATIGNVYTTPLTEIWASRKKTLGYCDRCTQGGYFQDSARIT